MMKVGTLLGACLLLAACQCGDDSVPSPSHATKAGKHGKAEEIEQQPKSVYKKAYDQARKEVTVKNAGSHLDALDGQIEREKEMMR